MPVGTVLHTPSCRVTLKVVGVVRDSDSPALMIQPLGTEKGRVTARRATVGQLSGYHLATGCENSPRAAEAS